MSKEAKSLVTCDRCSEVRIEDPEYKAASVRFWDADDNQRDLGDLCDLCTRDIQRVLKPVERATDASV